MPKIAARHSVRPIIRSGTLILFLKKYLKKSIVREEEEEEEELHAALYCFVFSTGK